MATWLEIKTEVKDEYSLNDEIFITDAELLSIANNGIERLESAIIASTPKYFNSTPFMISLENGTQDYALPSNIYANKINLIYYSSGSYTYELAQIKDLRKVMNIGTGERLSYLIVNAKGSGTKIRFFPTPVADEADVINLYYTRNVARLELDEDVLDLPEAKLYVKEYIKEKAKNKERLMPDAPESEHLKSIKEDVIAALANMIVDENNLVEVGEDPYEGFVGNGDY